jgi:hypothetical protein
MILAPHLPPFSCILPPKFLSPPVPLSVTEQRKKNLPAGSNPTTEKVIELLPEQDLTSKSGDNDCDAGLWENEKGLQAKKIV